MKQIKNYTFHTRMYRQTQKIKIAKDEDTVFSRNTYNPESLNGGIHCNTYNES